MDTKNEVQNASQNVESTPETTGTVGNVTVAQLEKVALGGKPARVAIDWDKFLPEVMEAAAAKKSLSVFSREYSQKYGAKELTVTQKYSNLRKSVAEAKDCTPEQVTAFLKKIEFSDGRKVKGIKRVHRNPRKEKPSLTKKLMSLAGIQEMLGDIPASTVGQELMETGFPGVKVGQTPLGDVTVQVDGKLITIHDNNLVGASA